MIMIIMTMMMMMMLMILGLQKGKKRVHRQVKKLLWNLPVAQVVAPHDEQNALTTTMVMVMLLMMMMMMIICQGWRENSARYTYNN